jgi:phosphoglycolate phosphatase-like HAD superfamily hydrolase
VQSIVFDFDGTLLNSKKRHQDVLYDAICAFSNSMLDPILDDFVEYKANGYSTKDYLQNKLKFSSQDANIITKYWKFYIEKYEYLTNDTLYNDSISTLDLLFGNYYLVLLSARQNKDMLYQQITNFGIKTYFENIICVDPFNAIYEKTNFIKNETSIILYIGDTEADYEAAGKIPFYAVNRGFRNRNYWGSRGISSFNDLSNLPHVLKKALKK